MTALEIEGLSVHFTGRGRPLVAVDTVSLAVPPGSVVGLVGESGSGKSTVARAVVGLVPPTTGRIRLDGTDLAALPSSARRRAGRRIQMVFQDPYSSLNPRMTVGASLSEALSAGERLDRDERAREVANLLDLVTLDQRYQGALPRELSGGQRQRVAIARALAVRPDVLICDEVTSALDASVTGAILNLLRDLRERLGLSLLFISHNLAVVRYVSDQIGVMYLGRLVEMAPAEELVSAPQHPYTQTLLDAVPRSDGVRDAPPSTLDEEPGDPRELPTGCLFHPRCPVGPTVDPSRTQCVSVDPWPGADARRHRAACHYAGLNAPTANGVHRESLPDGGPGP